MVDEKEFYDLMNQQDIINNEKINKNLMQMFEDEFVLTNVMRGYLNYLIKSNLLETLQSEDINKQISHNDAPVKKIIGFDISRHNNKSQMYFHKHTYLELDYAYRGNCSYYINNDNTVYQLKEKELCIVNQNVIHGIQTEKDEDILIKCMIPFESINLDHYNDTQNSNILKGFLSHALNKNLTNASYLVITLEDSPRIDQIIYSFLFEYVKRKQGWKQTIDNYISILFIELMRINQSSIRLVTDTAPEILNITKIINSIQKNYQSISLKDIAKDLNYHENYLSRVIKQQAKQSFRDLLSQVRLKEAEKLLLDTGLSVTEIAAKVGYLKPNYFFKLFKDHYGVTPMEYRASKIE